MKLTSFISWCSLATVIGLAGCSHGRSYSYSYYTGIKNPRAINHLDDEPETRPARVNSVDSKFHIVSKGETLYSIAWQYGQDVRDVAQWNRIQAPYTIYPNQKIRLTPPKLDKPVKRNPVIASNSGKNPPSQPVIKTKNSLKISWQWPTKGKIIGTYSARDSGKKGLDIAGKIGQRVYAAAGGQIVYSGSGLRGYGKLIIIKHNDTFFSAYAHNHRLFVKEEQEVKKGQHIADMGSSEADRAMLHFEVRRNGKPVDPLRYLPKRR